MRKSKTMGLILCAGLAAAAAHDSGMSELGDMSDRSQDSSETAVSALRAPDSSAAGGRGSDTLELLETHAVAHRQITAFNSQIIRDRDLSLRPMLDPADVVKVTPGLFTGQHAGGGKANQYFIRGFDADHGTDLSLNIDGMPINMVSHGHGQGYADLHFIIPELIDRVTIDKGPYDIGYGDLATAGSVSMATRQRLRESQVSVQAGMFNTYRVLDMTTLGAPTRPLMAAEVYRSDGPFDNPEDMERYNLFLKSPIIDNPTTRLSLTLMGYGAGWNGSGQIAQRAIDSGWVGRYGSLDPSEGGSSQRYSASLNFLDTPDADQAWEAVAYLIDYRLSLFSNFTFFAEDSINGDEINQRDDRVVAGMRSDYTRKYAFLGMPVSSRFGLASRNDMIENNLDHAVRRRIIGRKVDAEIHEGSLSAYFMESINPFPWLYVEAGLRGDHFGFDVVDKLHPADSLSITGVRDASVMSPKVNAVITPFRGTDIFLNYGEGFHSNDARGVTTPDLPSQGLAPARPLTKARGYEVGARTTLFGRWDLAASLWLLDMDGEFVWSGDAGGTEENGPTRRKGVDFETEFRILPWLWADYDMTVNSAVYTQDAGNANSVALAPRFTAEGGLSLRHPSGLYGSLRAQHLDDRPADETGAFTAYGFTVFDAALGYRWKKWEAFAFIGNLFNAKWYTAQFENDSRLKNPQGVLEPAAVTDMHLVPGAGFNIRGGLKRYF